MIKYSHFKFKDLSPDTFKRLARLTLRLDNGKESYMTQLLKQADKWPDTSVVLGYDTTAKQIVAWSSVNGGKHGLAANTFVQSKYRGQGIGKNLLRKQFEYNPSFKGFAVVAHDPQSHVFYGSAGAQRKGHPISKETPGSTGVAYLDRKILNPETHHQIKVKTALGYDKQKPVHKAAERLVHKGDEDRKKRKKQKPTILKTEWELKFRDKMSLTHQRNIDVKVKKLLKRIDGVRRNMIIRSKKYNVICDIEVDDLRQMALDAYGEKCKYSGRLLTVDNIVFDHKHPISKFGPSTKGNIQVISKYSNSMKGSLTEADFNTLLTWLQVLPEELRKDVSIRLAGGKR